MILDKKYIAVFSASFGLLALGVAAHGQTVISGTTYEYTGGTPLLQYSNAQSAQERTLEPYNAMNNPTGYTNPATGYGVGILNDGLLGNQAYLDGTYPGEVNPLIRADGYNGTIFAYQMEGAPGQTPSGAGMPTNTLSQVYGESMITNTGLTIQYNLGASYANLSTMNIYWNIDSSNGVPGAVTITDSNGHTVNYNWPNAAAEDAAAGGNNGPGPTGRGEYFEDSVNISTLSGQYLTLSIGGPTTQYQTFQEIDFTTTAVPEPASLGLLGIGGLALLRRKSRRA